MNDVLIVPNTIWKHTNGNLYRVLFLVNHTSLGRSRDKYPPSVVYEGVKNKLKWCRTIESWDRSMQKVT